MLRGGCKLVYYKMLGIQTPRACRNASPLTPMTARSTTNVFKGAIKLPLGLDAAIEKARKVPVSAIAFQRKYDDDQRLTSQTSYRDAAINSYALDLCS